MHADPLIASVALAAAVAWTMVDTAARKRMIDLRGARRRICPSCGRRISGRTCDRH
jgi:hypothetical protein